MGFTVEQWAKDWLKEQREKGEKCLEIKVSNNKHYVYRSTTRYDRATKKARKVSEYLGTLDPTEGFVKKKKNNSTHERFRTIRETGPLRLLDKVGGDMVGPLQRRFPGQWERIYAMAMLMAIDPVRMKNAADRWEKYEPVRGMGPAMSPNSLKDMYSTVGDERDAQLLFFKDMSRNVGEMAFDLSEFFSTSGELSLAEPGRNPEHDDRNQINIALSCDVTGGEPLYSKALFGSVRDVKSLVSCIKEMRHRDVVLVADRGFYSESNLEMLKSSGLGFAIPVRRNSDYYNQVSTNEFDAFVWRDRVIRFGKRTLDNGNTIYRFQNMEMSSNEEQNSMKKYLDGKITQDEFLHLKERMGHMVVVSNLDREPEWIYSLYKRRDSVEKDFRRMFEVLGADSLGVSDTSTARGMLFVLTLAVRLRVRLKNAIQKAGLGSDYSVDDVLFTYSKAYA
ncbi:MAG: transposase, partial [archaeon]|nr:transposase [archaeon]